MNDLPYSLDHRGKYSLVISTHMGDGDGDGDREREATHTNMLNIMASYPLLPKHDQSSAEMVALIYSRGDQHEFAK